MQMCAAPLLPARRVYADVNVHRPREYWDYERLEVRATAYQWYLRVELRLLHVRAVVEAGVGAVAGSGC
jgi:hypothetical protein